MAGIKIGSTDVKSVYIGGRMANSVYLGRTLLWTMFVPRVATFTANGGHYTYMNGDHSFLSRDSIGSPISNGRMTFFIYLLTPATLNVEFSTSRRDTVFSAGTRIPAGTRIDPERFRDGQTVIFTEAQA